ADERAAALERVQRSGGQDGDAQSCWPPRRNPDGASPPFPSLPGDYAGNAGARTSVASVYSDRLRIHPSLQLTRRTRRASSAGLPAHLFIGGGPGRGPSRPLPVDLSPLELGWPLLEEGARAFPVVLAAEGLEAELPQPVAVRFRDALEQGLHLGLRPAHRKGGVGRHGAQVVVGV